jgi:S-DNA-T family DNA segregation ATPase FtsK/SpoIIIE
MWTSAIFLALALASYAGEPSLAPSPNAVPHDPIVGENWVGPVGEACARCLVQLVGLASWSIPLELFLLGIPFVRGKENNLTPARLGGDMLLLVLGAALVQVGWPTAVAFGKHPSAGLVGELFGEVARSLFSTVGSFLVGFSLVGLILIARATFSFIALVHTIAAFFKALFTRTTTGARSVAEAWAAARALERAADEKERAAATPKIKLSRGEEAFVAASLDDDDETFVPPEESVLPPPVKSKRSRARAPRAKDATPAKGDDAEADAAVDEPPPATEKAPAPGLKAEGAQAPRARRGKKAEPREESPLDLPDDLDEGPKFVIDTSSELFAGAASEPETDDLEDDATADDASADDAPESEPALALATPEKRPAAKAPVTNAEAITIVDTSCPARARQARARARASACRRRTCSTRAHGIREPRARRGAAPQERRDAREDTRRLQGLSGKVEEILPGPVVTTFEVSPVPRAPRCRKVASLADDLALGLAQEGAHRRADPREEPHRLRAPERKRLPVNLRELVEDKRFQT